MAGHPDADDGRTVQALALGNARPEVFIVLRWQLYLYNLISDVGWVDGRLSIASATAALAIVDSGTAWWMRRSGAPLFSVRILYDLAAVAVLATWVPTHAPYTGVALMTAPLIIDLVAVCGFGYALCFTFVAAIDMVLARRSIGGEEYFSDLAFNLGLILLFSFLALSALDRLADATRSRGLAEEQAFRGLTQLSVRNDLQLGAGGQIGEALYRGWFQLEQVTETGRAQRLAFQREREDLVTATRATARYVGDVLREFAVEQRRGKPAVSEHLHLGIAPTEGLQVLTADQARNLIEQLRCHSLKGRHRVQIVSCDSLTGEVSLLVGSVHVHVPPARGREIPLIRLALWLSFAAMLSMTSPSYAQVPFVPVLSVAASITMLGLWAEARYFYIPNKGTLLLWICAFLPVGAAIALTTILPVRWALPDGRILLVAGGGVMATGFILAGLWRHLGAVGKAGSSLAFVAALMLVCTTNPKGEPSLRYIVGDLCFPAAAIAVTYLFDQRNRMLGAQLHVRRVRDLRRQEALLTQQAFADEQRALARQVEALRKAVELAPPGDHKCSAFRWADEAQTALDEMTATARSRLTVASPYPEVHS